MISPILFDLYVNDLLVELGQMVKEINVKAFADDIMAICYGREQTKQVIDTITKWAEANSMEVNTEKSQIVQLRRSTKEKSMIRQIGGLKTVDSYKYLGIPFDMTLSMNGMFE